MKKIKKKWKNIKSLKVLKGKEASSYYDYLVRAYPPKEAERLWEQFKYGQKHGQSLNNHV